MDLDLELTVSRGRGYSPAEERGKLPLGEIPVDAIYSPVRKVNYTVTRARIGQQTNYDRLVLEIWTTARSRPKCAARGCQAADAPSDADRRRRCCAGRTGRCRDAAGVPSRIYDVPIEELELTVRAYNCLKRAGITKVGEVLERLEKGEEEILAIRNFGRKSLERAGGEAGCQGLPVGHRVPVERGSEIEEDGEAPGDGDVDVDGDSARSLTPASTRRRAVRGVFDETSGCRTQTGPQCEPTQRAVARPHHGAVPARSHQHHRGQGPVHAGRCGAPDHGGQAGPGDGGNSVHAHVWPRGSSPIPR